MITEEFEFKVEMTVNNIHEILSLPPMIKSLKCSRGVSDKELSAIAEFDMIEVLDLSGCGQITVNGFKELIRIKTLKEISLVACDQITDDEIKYLAEFPNLQKIDLFLC